MPQNADTKRIIAWIAMAAVTCVMLFSVLFISQHADHDCTGADCSVCASLEQCYNNIKSIGTMTAVATVVFFLWTSIQKDTEHEAAACCDCSLISQKVRMNN